MLPCLDLEDVMIVKHSGCPKLSWKTLQLFLHNGNSNRSLDFAYSSLLSYGFGMGAKITCLKTFILYLLWVSRGSPHLFWCRGVVRPKPFAVAQHVLSTHCNTAVKTADTACLQIGGLCWYPSEGTFAIWVVLWDCLTFATLVTFVTFGLVVGLLVLTCCIYKFREYWVKK